MIFKARVYVLVMMLMSVAVIGYGHIRYLNGWNAHSEKINAAYALKKQSAEAVLVSTEKKAASVSAEGKVIYRTITRDVVKYVQDSNRTRCNFDIDAVSMRQQAIDAANNIAGFDEPAVQTQFSGER